MSDTLASHVNWNVGWKFLTNLIKRCNSTREHDAGQRQSSTQLRGASDAATKVSKNRISISKICFCESPLLRENFIDKLNN
jgi:hypothetical protein